MAYRSRTRWQREQMEEMRRVEAHLNWEFSRVRPLTGEVICRRPVGGRYLYYGMNRMGELSWPLSAEWVSGVIEAELGGDFGWHE